MGDMADMLIKQGIDNMLDGHEELDGGYHIECKYCGRGNLAWWRIESGWRLFDKNGIMHSCLKHNNKTIS